MSLNNEGRKPVTMVMATKMLVDLLDYHSKVPTTYHYN